MLRFRRGQVLRRIRKKGVLVEQSHFLLCTLLFSCSRRWGDQIRYGCQKKFEFRIVHGTAPTYQSGSLEGANLAALMLFVPGGVTRLKIFQRPCLADQETVQVKRVLICSELVLRIHVGIYLINGSYILRPTVRKILYPCD